MQHRVSREKVFSLSLIDFGILRSPLIIVIMVAVLITQNFPKNSLCIVKHWGFESVSTRVIQPHTEWGIFAMYVLFIVLFF